jgi:MazG family protein
VPVSEEAPPTRTARPLEPAPATGEPRTDALRRLVDVIDRLRDPQGGCPWDLEQTVESMAPSLIEEAHELVEAVERGDRSHTIEEAGDVLLVVFLVCRIAEQAGEFDLAQAANGTAEKLIRRHPHVFGDVDQGSSSGAIEQWEEIKRRERAEKGTDTSALAGVPAAMPALQRADRMSAKAVSAGFRWARDAGTLAKLREEVEELAEVFPEEGKPTDEARLEAELGDVLLAAATVGSYVGIDPERALRAALRRYESRFRQMEQELGGLEGRGLDEMMSAWERAKRREGSGT